MQASTLPENSPDPITNLLLLAAKLMAATGLLLLETDTAIQQGTILGASPDSISGRQIHLSDTLMKLAGKSPVSAEGVMLPTTFTRWLGGRASHLVIHPLPKATSQQYLLACWANGARPTSLTDDALRQSAELLPPLIDHEHTAREQGELASRLDIVMDNVALGIAFLDTDGHCRLNAIAAGLLNLPIDTIDAANFAVAMRATRARCEIEQSEHLATQDIYGDVIVPQAELWILPDRKKIVQVESRAVGDTRNPGRFWVFTDISAIWNNAERLRNLNDKMQETNTRLEAEIVERMRVEQALHDREAELRRYAEDLEVSRSSIEQQAAQAIEMAETLAEQKLALEHSKQQSDFLANHDALTGLFNRRAFHVHLAEMMERGKMSRSQVGIMFIDLDKFKLVNDTLGHGCGDDLLKQVADALNGILRETDLVARLGGDEFAVATRFAAGKKPESLAPLAERIRLALHIPVATPDGEIEVCATIGVAIYPGDASDADAILIQADHAMYAGKQRGRNMVVFSHEMTKEPNSSDLGKGT